MNVLAHVNGFNKCPHAIAQYLNKFAFIRHGLDYSLCRFALILEIVIYAGFRTVTFVDLVNLNYRMAQKKVYILVNEC
jgi:hypothetical protein